MIEVWKSIPGYEGFYEVSDQGRVRSLDRDIPHPRGGTHHRKGRLLKPCIDGTGRGAVALYVENHRTLRSIHQLVLEAFVGPCPGGMEVCHWNDVCTDNRLENLRWDSHRNNGSDAKRNGRLHPAFGEANGLSKLHAADIPVIGQSTLTLRALAELYGVSISTIHMVKTGRTWRALCKNIRS